MTQDDDEPEDPSWLRDRDWLIAKLTSESSSSPSKSSLPCDGGGVFADASVEAHAPLAIERDTPANPNAGKALLRRLRLDERFSMAPFSCLLGHIEPAAQRRYSFRVDTGASDKKVRTS